MAFYGGDSKLSASKYYAVVAPHEQPAASECKWDIVEIGPKASTTPTLYIASEAYSKAVAVGEDILKQLVKAKHSHTHSNLADPQIVDSGSRKRKSPSPKQELSTAKRPRSDVIAEINDEADEAYRASDLCRLWAAYQKLAAHLSSFSAADEMNSAKLTALQKQVDQQKKDLWTQSEVDDAVEAATTKATEKCEKKYKQKLSTLKDQVEEHEEKIKTLKLQKKQAVHVTTPSSQVDSETVRKTHNEQNISLMNAFGDNMAKVILAQNGTEFTTAGKK